MTNCPLPNLDFEFISLAHGSGGLMMQRLLDKMIFEALGNQWLNKQHDGAFINMSGQIAFSTDSFVVSPVFFPGGNIGELAVNGTVNDLAMCGAIPKYLSLAFIIEEGLPVADLWEILQGIKQACGQSGVHIVTGDTKVVEKNKGDKIFINTSGIGLLHANANINANRIEPEDKIIISGNVATHGVAILSVRKGLEFETTIKSDTTPLHELTIDLLEKFGDKIRFFRDPTRGGLAAVLNEIATQAKLAMELQETTIPVLPQVAAACEMLGLDPLNIANEGIFVAIVAPEIADEALTLLQNFDKGKNAACIGTVKAAPRGKVLLQSNFGGRRVVSMPLGEQLPRIC